MIWKFLNLIFLLLFTPTCKILPVTASQQGNIVTIPYKKVIFRGTFTVTAVTAQKTMPIFEVLHCDVMFFNCDGITFDKMPETFWGPLFLRNSPTVMGTVSLQGNDTSEPTTSSSIKTITQLAPSSTAVLLGVILSTVLQLHRKVLEEIFLGAFPVVSNF